MRFGLIIIIFLSVTHIIQSQTKFFDGLNIEPECGYGFIMGHHGFFNFYYQHHPYTYDIRISKKTDGKKQWHFLYRYPTTGFGFHHAWLGNDLYLGHSNAVYKFINIPILKGENITWNYTIGAGIAFLSKYFDTDSNYYNLAIGSCENAYFNLSQDVRIFLTKKTSIKTSIGITHYSNGSWAQPNAGINLITVNTSIRWSLGQETEEQNTKNNDFFDKKNELLCIINGGVREISPPTGKKYFISTFSLNINRQFWKKRKLGAGLDFFYDSSLRDQILRYEGATYTDMIYYKTGIHVSHDLIFGNSAIIMQAGCYILAEYKSDGFIYSRFGIQQKINDNFFINLSLKTHFFTADYIEWGVGYKIL
ncbi:MAG: hypothetical protein Kow0068_06880 [Marinilabiliales bacterium]